MKLTKAKLKRIINEEIKSLQHGFFDKMLRLRSDDAEGMIKTLDAAMADAPDPETKPRSQEEVDRYMASAKSLQKLRKQLRNAGLDAVPNKKQRAYAESRLMAAQELGIALRKAASRGLAAIDSRAADARAAAIRKKKSSSRAPERRGRYDDMSAKDIGFATDMNRGDYTRTYPGAGTSLRSSPSYYGDRGEFDPFREGKVTEAELRKIVQEVTTEVFNEQEAKKNEKDSGRSEKR